MSITVRELRGDTKKMLDAMEKGEAGAITRHGKPAAPRPLCAKALR